MAHRARCQRASSEIGCHSTGGPGAAIVAGRLRGLHPIPPTGAQRKGVQHGTNPSSAPDWVRSTSGDQAACRLDPRRTTNRHRGTLHGLATPYATSSRDALPEYLPPRRDRPQPRPSPPPASKAVPRRRHGTRPVNPQGTAARCRAARRPGDRLGGPPAGSCGASRTRRAASAPGRGARRGSRSRDRRARAPRARGNQM